MPPFNLRVFLEKFHIPRRVAFAQLKVMISFTKILHKAVYSFNLAALAGKTLKHTGEKYSRRHQAQAHDIWLKKSTSRQQSRRPSTRGRRWQDYAA